MALGFLLCKTTVQAANQATNCGVEAREEHISSPNLTIQQFSIRNPMPDFLRVADGVVAKDRIAESEAAQFEALKAEREAALEAARNPVPAAPANPAVAGQNAEQPAADAPNGAP